MDPLDVIIVIVAIVCLVLAALILVGGWGRKAWVGGAGRPREAPGPREKGGKTRGEEVDEAAAVAPTALLERGLPSPGIYAFDLAQDGSVERTQREAGLYMGLSNRDPWDRSTRLSPANLRFAARQTSGREYAWVVFDGPEACVAVRADPVEGKVFDLDEDSLIRWMKTRLVGDPPHKLSLNEYLEHLAELGLRVESGPAREKEIRFDLISVTTEEERATMRRGLVALDGPAFEALDWSAYDAAVSQGACTSAVELSGEVVIDLAARKVSAPKVRANRLYSSWTHPRSYVNFHTHPAARFRGNAPEPPSSGDLQADLYDAAHRGLVWAFVSSPEGTYIVRPSDQLVRAYLQDPEGAATNAIEAYEASLPKSGGVLARARAVVGALAEAGFIAHFREAPCVPLLSKPDTRPDYNALDRESYKASLKEVRAMAGPALLSADWSQVLAANGLRGGSGSSWSRARLAEGVVVPGEGHMFGDPSDRRSYPLGAPGPLMVIYFEEGDFPRRIPAAASGVAKENADSWPWMAFLSPSRVLVFRADSSGIEVHGPRIFAAPRSTQTE